MLLTHASLLGVLFCCAYCLLGLVSRKCIQGKNLMVDSQAKQLPKQVFFVYLLANLPFMPPVWSLKAWLFLIFGFLSCLNLSQLHMFFLWGVGLHFEGEKCFYVTPWVELTHGFPIFLLKLKIRPWKMHKNFIIYVLPVRSLVAYYIWSEIKFPNF